ncbi:TetR/AcrR family transcriptional regulator [Sciscionella marina]|uniref:TetR/AcrR family transcriptional regulator n=1 Tax=Sciscionella marina TaxID=508770 RepID=UPI00036D685A|nr:TetR/AcrR family transcriptional regulator [Sciscionella marina]
MSVDVPARRGRRLEPDARREQIFECARTLFLAGDYSAVSTGDIAAAAGVARGLINHYFGTKRALYLEVLRESLTLPPIPELDLPQGSLEEQVTAGVTWFVEFVWRNRQAWIALSGVGPAADQDIRQIVHEAEETCTDRLLAAIELGERLVDEGSRATIRAFAGMVRATAAEWLVRGSMDRERVRELLSCCLLAILRDVLAP